MKNSSTLTATQMVSALVPKPHVERLQQIAHAHDRNFSAEIRRAVREYIERERTRT
jgi:predicted transcriptional regulator